MSEKPLMADDNPLLLVNRVTVLTNSPTEPLLFVSVVKLLVPAKGIIHETVVPKIIINFNSRGCSPRYIRKLGITVW